MPHIVKTLSQGTRFCEEAKVMELYADTRVQIFLLIFRYNSSYFCLIFIYFMLNFFLRFPVILTLKAKIKTFLGFNK